MFDTDNGTYKLYSVYSRYSDRFLSDIIVKENETPRGVWNKKIKSIVWLTIAKEAHETIDTYRRYCQNPIFVLRSTVVDGHLIK